MVKKKTRPKLSAAVRTLRIALGHTQQSFATSMGVSLQSVAVWETRRAPSPPQLVRLWKLAAEEGYNDLARIFAEAVQADPRLYRDKLKPEMDRWLKLTENLEQLLVQLALLAREDPARFQEMWESAKEARRLARESQEWNLEIQK